MSGRARLAAQFIARHPESAAKLLETLAPEDVGRLVVECDAAVCAKLLGHMLPAAAARAVQDVPADHLADLLRRMESPDAVALLRQFPEHARNALLATLPRQWSAAFELLLRYAPGTVGAWTETFVLTLPDDVTVGEARDRIESGEQHLKARVYVLDRDRRVRGAVRGLTLLRASPHVRLTQAMEPAQTLWARETVETALDSPLWERHAEAPVVNRERELVGVVSYADLRRAQRRLTRPGASSPSQGLSEVAELLATGANGIWQSVGELVQSNTNARKSP